MRGSREDIRRNAGWLAPCASAALTARSALEPGDLSGSCMTLGARLELVRRPRFQETLLKYCWGELNLFPE
jgi:hypothetical protein